MGLRSPRLPHAKGVLYQMSYDPKILLFRNLTPKILLSVKKP